LVIAILRVARQQSLFFRASFCVTSRFLWTIRDWSTFNFETDWQKTDFMASILDATSIDLSRFHKLGRKLLLYHGWSDETTSPLRTLDYYRDVRARLGAKETQDSVRLFMAPGMFHCDYGGPGPNTFDYISALEQWVEKGVPPEQMLATHFDFNGNPDRTRPLCAYPKVAKYTTTEVQLLNPGSGMLTPTGGLGTARVGHTATLLQDEFW
jgi:hypothetical protein